MNTQYVPRDTDMTKLQNELVNKPNNVDVMTLLAGYTDNMLFILEAMMRELTDQNLQNQNFPLFTECSGTISTLSQCSTTRPFSTLKRST